MRPLMLSLLLGVMVTGTAAGAPWQALVLKGSSVQDDGAGNLIITLASGAVVTVPKEDWSETWSQALDEVLRKQEAEKAVSSSAAPPSDATAAAMIRSNCARDWQADFVMRKFCEDQQYEGLRGLRSRTMDGTLAPVRSKCASDWPEDFVMRDFCETQQIDALRQLNR